MTPRRSRYAPPSSSASAQVSPMQPPWLPSSRVQSSGFCPAASCASGVAEETASGEDPGRHGLGEREEQHDAAHERGVGKVLADAAEELLDRDDGDQTAEHGLPQRDGHRQVVGQNHARHHGGQIIDRGGLVAELFKAPLEKHARGGAHRRHEQRPPAEDDHSGDECRTQGDEHVAHDLPGRCAGIDMRGSGDHKLHFCTASFFASSFSLCSLRQAASFALASLLVCTSGRCAGQPNEQQPHSMQRLTLSSASRSISPAS